MNGDAASSVVEAVEFDAFLERCLLPDHLLAEAEAEFPGLVETKECGRYGALVQAEDKFLEFRVYEVGGGKRELTVTHNGRTPNVRAWMLQLAWHRAARSILTVRTNHRRYNEKRRK